MIDVCGAPLVHDLLYVDLINPFEQVAGKQLQPCATSDGAHLDLFGSLLSSALC